MRLKKQQRPLREVYLFKDLLGLGLYHSCTLAVHLELLCVFSLFLFSRFPFLKLGFWRTWFHSGGELVLSLMIRS